MAIKTKPSPQKGNQNTQGAMALVLVGIAAAAIYGGNMAAQMAEDFKQELLNLKAQHERAISDNATLSQKIRRAESEMEKVRSQAKRWEKAERALNKPWTINAVEWLSRSARQQNPPVSPDNTSSESAAGENLGRIDMQVHGDFQSLLNWLMLAEHELSMIRVVGATWQNRNQDIVGLSVNFEVDNHE